MGLNQKNLCYFARLITNSSEEFVLCGYKEIMSKNDCSCIGMRDSYEGRQRYIERYARKCFSFTSDEDVKVTVEGLVRCLKEDGLI